MNEADRQSGQNRKMKSVFERYLTLWVGLCILGGIALGKRK